MLSYQHAYHAGNAADLHKHAALAALLGVLTAKPRGISYLESHAGRGLYDLDADEARKTGEAAGGIDRIGADGLPEPLRTALAAVRARHGARAYPGSPGIAAALLRPQDRMVLAELHPAEHAELRANVRQRVDGPEVEIHRRDGHEAMLALTPPKPRRGLALIDPSYEVKDEYALTARTALAMMRRWPEGVAMIWYPLLPAGRHVALTGPLVRAGLPGTLRHEAAFRESPERGMQGSGLLFLNLPHGAEAAIRVAWEPLSPVLAGV